MFRTYEQSDPAHSPEGLTFLTVKSAALGQRADLTLYVPPEAQGRADVPLVLLLHGIYGSHWAWAFSGGAHRTLARITRSQAVPPMVLCMPSDGLWGDGSGYIAHARQDFERWIVEEVPAAARRASNALSEKSPLFIAGLSMGGFGALRLASKYPKRFRAASAHSAITDLSQLHPLVAEPLCDDLTPLEDRNVLAALTRGPTPPPMLRFDCGTEDPLLAANRELHRTLDAAGIQHRYEEYPGSHDWRYWARRVENTFAFFSDVLRHG